MLPFAALRNHIYQIARTLLRCKALPAGLLTAQVPPDEHREVLDLLVRKGLLSWLSGGEVALTPRGIELARACERWRVDKIAEWHKSRIASWGLRTILVSAAPEKNAAPKGGTLSIPMLKP